MHTKADAESGKRNKWTAEPGEAGQEGVGEKTPRALQSRNSKCVMGLV